MDGKIQSTKLDAKAVVIRNSFTKDQDVLTFDLRLAYDCDELKKLERTFIYDRGKSGQLTINDEVVFGSPKKFGTALITFSKWEEVSPGRLRIYDGAKALEIEITQSAGEIVIKSEEIKEELKNGLYPTRIGIDFKQPVTNAVISMKIKAINQ